MNQNYFLVPYLKNHDFIKLLVLTQNIMLFVENQTENVQ